jgi:hypothetical protein
LTLVREGRLDLDVRRIIVDDAPAATGFPGICFLPSNSVSFARRSMTVIDEVRAVVFLRDDLGKRSRLS